MLEIEEFISTLLRKGSLNTAADNTKIAYTQALNKLQVFLGDRELTQDMAQEFIRGEMDRGLKHSSVAIGGRAIKRYLEWSGQDSDKVLLPTPKRKLPDYYEKSELDKLVKGARTPLERTIVIVLSDTGLRISELLALRKKDIDKENGFIYAHREKTGAEGWIPISDGAVSALDDYIKWANPKGIKLFPYSYHQIYIWLKDLGNKVGLVVRPHKFRHTAAALRAIDGQKIETIADLLGHKRLDTTRIYASLKPKQLKKEIKPIW